MPMRDVPSVIIVYEIMRNGEPKDWALLSDISFNNSKLVLHLKSHSEIICSNSGLKYSNANGMLA